MANLLRFETSPYLLQHQHNPVHWRPWGAAAFAEAAAADRPILLSIGYAACHWCHVMAHESFENAETAALMNALFVNIKVDREERPDVDQLYMAALQSFGEQGGWPLTMFLMPDGKPIWGGTYFPPEHRYGQPAFRDVIAEVARLYHTDRAAIASQSERLTAHLARPRDGLPEELDAATLEAAVAAILPILDPLRGSTRGAPKFPNAPLHDFLARSAARLGRDDLDALVRTTLKNLSLGGIYDHVGGGLARYSTDALWLVPHFEKMLYDNAQFVEQLTYALRGEEDDPLFLERIEETVAFMLTELRSGASPDGEAFLAGLDADSEGVEGRFYVWTRAELNAVLNPDDAAFFATLYDITQAGNWEGHSIPNRLATPQHLTAKDDARRLAILARLRDRRAERPRPAVDDQILADWNGLAISALAKAGFRLERADWIEAARRAYAIVSKPADAGSRPCHVRCRGRRGTQSLASDLAGLAHAALHLFTATQDQTLLADAENLLALLERHHSDGRGGYFLAPNDGEQLVARRLDRTDEAVPNTHGMAASAYTRLWALTGDDRHRIAADRILAAAAPAIRQNVFGTASLLSALDLRLCITTIVIMVPENDSPDRLLQAVRGHFARHIVLQILADKALLPATHPAHGKHAIENRATAYVCREGRCSPPVVKEEALAALMRAA